MEGFCPSYEEILHQYALRYDTDIRPPRFRPYAFCLDFLNWILLVGYLLTSRKQWNVVERVRHAIFLFITWLSMLSVMHSRTVALAYGMRELAFALLGVSSAQLH